ncbi:enoyl-CoA hydratase-related protein [Chachezhania sediminis]|uniref:enoyl-CoA hydratase-related protein n=1 Tax=Chachezhania sediminis TaxID=2599291 RepID=UPI00131D2EB2|nr:enoyl-CoA hydratase-related protein [Chachezhania sediminis]
MANSRHEGAFTRIEVDGRIATVAMDRPDKRNAMSDGLLAELDGFFSDIPTGVRCIILTGTDGHFCAGLDPSEHKARDAEGEGLTLARKLAADVADNATLSNYVMIHAIARIGDMARSDGLFTESLCAALTQTSPDATEGLAALLEKRPPVFL